MSFYGLLNLPWWGYIIFTLVSTHITMACITIFLHRGQAHRALDLHPIASHFCRFWLWFTTGMKTKEWVAVHRKHHAKCETIDDPHSPQVEGLSTVLWQGAELYRAEKKIPETLEKYGKGTPDDWLERHVYSTKFLRGKLGIILLLYVDLLLLGGPGLIVWGVQMAWTPFFAAGIINGIGHYFGYRNFECPDAARNIIPWGIFVAGEELHNNHHTYGTSAKLSVKWWEFDIGWAYIKTLSILGLAKVKRLPPTPKALANKHEVDMDTLKAIINNRLQLLTRYMQEVIVPVFKSERKNTWDNIKYRSLCAKTKSLLKRNDALIKPEEMPHIDRALANSRTLAVVYEYRRRLQEIWSRTTASNAELLQALHQWCVEAEKSGIKQLQEFVAYIRSYHLKEFA
ncbi:MAG: oLE [Gammaproteobacteria bacterium]|jgi:stearoyl-CoA desaturase (delta-9 desaturase)|nr:oLE [Gammaproteobacteria bacterium]